jgi:hypothetical protein
VIEADGHFEILSLELCGGPLSDSLGLEAHSHFPKPLTHDARLMAQDHLVLRLPVPASGWRLAFRKRSLDAVQEDFLFIGL